MFRFGVRGLRVPFGAGRLGCMEQQGEMLTRRQAMKLAGVSYNGIRGWEKQGRVTPVRTMDGRVEKVLIPRAQIEQIIVERVEEVTGPLARPGDEALRVEVKLLREALDKSEAERAALQRRYDTLLEKVLVDVR